MAPSSIQALQCLRRCSIIVAAWSGTVRVRLTIPRLPRHRHAEDADEDPQPAGFALTTGFLWWAAAVALGHGTAAVVNPTLIAQVSDLVKPRNRASGVGIYRPWRDFGYVAGGLLTGLLVDLLEFRSAIGSVAIITRVRACSHAPICRVAGRQTRLSGGRPPGRAVTYREVSVRRR
jgi:MFS family permease